MQNITFIVDELGGGGAARVASNLCSAWAAMGRNVTILTSDDGRFTFTLANFVPAQFSDQWPGDSAQ